MPPKLNHNFQVLIYISVYCTLFMHLLRFYLHLCAILFIQATGLALQAGYHQGFASYALIKDYNQNSVCLQTNRLVPIKASLCKESCRRATEGLYIVCFYNPSVSLRLPPPLTQGRLFFTSRNEIAEALDMRMSKVPLRCFWQRTDVFN